MSEATKQKPMTWSQLAEFIAGLSPEERQQSVLLACRHYYVGVAAKRDVSRKPTPVGGHTYSMGPYLDPLKKLE